MMGNKKTKKKKASIKLRIGYEIGTPTQGFMLSIGVLSVKNQFEEGNKTFGYKLHTY